MKRIIIMAILIASAFAWSREAKPLPMGQITTSSKASVPNIEISGTHVQNVAACQSGTSALHLSLIEAGVKPGDAVIVPPLTFIAAVNPVKYQYATPVFVDCDDSFCMDPIKLRKFCEEECVYKDNQLFYKNQHI